MTAHQKDISWPVATSVPKIDPRLIHILSNPLRVRLLELLSDRVSLTPLEALKLLEDGGYDLRTFAYHVTVLHDFKLVELAPEADHARGVAYRLSPKSFIEDTLWHQIPSGLKSAAWVAALQAFTQHSVNALQAGTIEKRGSQFNLLPVALDEQGWLKTVSALAESLQLVEEAHRESVERALSSPSGESDLSSALVALTAFESSPALEGMRD